LLLRVEGSPHIDEVVGDYAESCPSFHSANALVPASAESVPLLEHADASFASGSPFLTSLKPAFLLLPLECGAFGGAAWNGNAFHAHLMRLGNILRRVKSGIACCQVGYPAGTAGPYWSTLAKRSSALPVARRSREGERGNQALGDHRLVLELHVSLLLATALYLGFGVSWTLLIASRYRRHMRDSAREALSEKRLA